MLMRLLVISACLAPAASLAQGLGTPTQSGSAESPQDVGSVQVGAGSNGDVTTGASGPQQVANPAVDSLPPAFDIQPPKDPFFGPKSLPISAPQELRCDLIGPPKARARCEGKAHE